MEEIERYFDNYSEVAFGKVCAFFDLVSAQGELRGLVGPRELPRLWERHILNSASLAEYIVKKDGVITDIGSGAGFPGLILACMFPKCQVYLVDSMLRRTDWLQYAAETIGLENVTVVRGRAEELAGKIPPADYVVSRAVAPLTKLLAWTLPFLKSDGEFLALKGSSVHQEITDAKKALQGKTVELLEGTTIPSAEKTTVLRVTCKNAM